MKTLLLIALLLSVIGLFTATVHFFKLMKTRNLLQDEVKPEIDLNKFKR